MLAISMMPATGQKGNRRNQSLQENQSPGKNEIKIHDYRETGMELCDDLEGWDEWGERDVQEGGDVCIQIADSLHSTPEINMTL